jgi:hypothetical protein
MFGCKNMASVLCYLQFHFKIPHLTVHVIYDNSFFLRIYMTTDSTDVSYLS